MISDIIAKVILKILEAFGIKPPVQDKKAKNLYTSAKRVQGNGDLYTRSVEMLDPPTVSQAPRGHKLPGAGTPSTPAAPVASADTAGEVATEPAAILPPEATDPTDAPDWINAQYGDDWKTHVNK